MERNLLEREIKANKFSAQVGEFIKKPGGWLGNLPLVICGPILRKIYYDSVSVWIAFKEEVKDIKLEVFAPGSSSVNIFKETNAPLIKLGKNLYITLATAVNPSKKLISDTIYEYNLSFTHEGKYKQLKDSGVLKDGIESIAYHPYKLPTFCLPSDDINNLKIVHGSCRMAHGGKTDALRAVDTMIEIAPNYPKLRPQLLFLTGDQIYADEVADSLLYLIQKAASQLFGWTEKPSEGIKLQPPGWRTNLIKSTGFTTNDTKSHLITFQEFFLMYLFCFSDVLWTEKFPEIEEMFPNLEKLDANVKKSVINKKFPYISGENKALQSFIKGLPFVRKAMANISTLMIFDDHEITDDWHIDINWNNKVLKNLLGRRIILNGLLAYSAFQDWGNDYVKYSSHRNLDLLKSLNEITTRGYPNESINSIEKSIVPISVRAKDRTIFKSDFNWNYLIEYNGFNIVCLDTRTKRVFIDNEKPLGNLILNVRSQFGVKKLDSGKLLVLVSAPPVFGNVPLEDGQEKLRKGELNELTGLIGGRIAGEKGMYPRDQEAWIFSPSGFEALLNVLTDFKKVLILSGDVHHSLTSLVRLYKKDKTSYQLTEIVQITSSGLKRTTESYHYPSTDKWPYRLRPRTDSPYRFIKVSGMSPSKDFPMLIENKFYYLDNPYIKNRNVGLKIEAGLQYSVKFMTSTERVIFNFKETRQEKIAKFIRNFSETTSQRTAVGKDNISLVSFTPNSVINKFWYASGGHDKPSDVESSNLLLPFTTHRIEFNNKIDNNEIPINVLSKMRGIKLEKV